MYKCNTLAALVAAVLLATAGTASAQAVTVQGGGASLPADLYKGSADSILPANFSYAVTGSGTGKKAFLGNDMKPFGKTDGSTVHFIGSDSILSAKELADYASAHLDASKANRFGPLIQIPSVATSVTIPFNKPGNALNLDVEKICGVFSGKLTEWSQVDPSRTGPITVVYRKEGSGTSELFTRFLAAACQPAHVVGSKLKVVNSVPAFSVQSTFSDLFVDGVVPSNFVAAATAGGTPLYNEVYAADGRIGYVGPDVIPSLTDATKVAKVKGKSPDEVSVQATLDTIAPPTGAAANDPANWVPVFANPNAGYPIAGYTNLVIGQCYKDSAVASDIKAFLQRHYSTTKSPIPAVDAALNTERAVRSHGFIPLTTLWRDAIRARFVDGNNVAGINNPSTCAGIGRP